MPTIKNILCIFMIVEEKKMKFLNDLFIHCIALQKSADIDFRFDDCVSYNYKNERK